MTEKEKMIAGQLYNCGDNEILEEQAVWQAKLWEFNRLRPDQEDEMDAYMHEVFAECGESNYIQLPFRANWGGHHVHFGSNVWVGAGAIILPGVSIGDNSVIGAGSVVTKDIPANVVAYGNPCRVARKFDPVK